VEENTAAVELDNTEETGRTSGIVGSTETVSQPTYASCVTKLDTKLITVHGKKTKKGYEYHKIHLRKIVNI
jgi:hypothetical protein